MASQDPAVVGITYLQQLPPVPFSSGVLGARQCVHQLLPIGADQ